MGAQMKYDPLIPSQNQIRLLTLHPSKTEDPIQCTLSIISLDSNHAFSALSYVWGAEKITTEITVDGIPIQVTTNLASALQHIRKKFGQIVIWIDAICINQSDNEEKGKQLQLMGEIYRNAEQVIGWLGPEGDDSDLALEMFRRIPRATFDHIIHLSSKGRWDDVGVATRPNSKVEHTGWVQEMPQLTAKFWYYFDPERSVGAKLAKLRNKEPPRLKPKFWHRGNFRSLGQLVKRGDWQHVAWTLNPKFGTLSPAWLAIRAFFKRDYWTRIWILQEFILASKLVLMCGNEILDEKAVEGVEQMLHLLHLCSLNQHPKGMDSPAFAAFNSDTAWKSAYMTIMLRSSPGEKRLRELVAGFQVLDATNPRDRIYALMGLSVDKIEPKYGDSVDKVYCEFAAKWVDEDKDASILAYAELNGRGDRLTSRKRQLPSWVPDWEHAQVEPDSKSRFNSMLYGKTSIKELANYHASSQACSWRVTNNLLFAPGVRFDSILSLGPQMSLDDKPIREYFRTYLDASNEGLYPTGISRGEAIFRLIMLDMDSYTKQRLDPTTKTYAELAHGFAYGIISNRSLPQETAVLAAIELASELSGPYLDEALSGVDFLTTLFTTLLRGGAIGADYGVQEQRDQLQVDLIESVDAVYSHMLGELRGGWTNMRKVFGMGNGYFGIGPGDMQERDVVAVLDGCSMPVILRRVGEEYLFLGLCFVLGIMDGEVDEMLVGGKMKRGEFRIR